ncbi:MAG: RNA polymerase sigma factor SigM [Actinobacteria bacterium]|nr:RNA polymerase sigma factor SigM [Actinomycetota bacterium]
MESDAGSVPLTELDDRALMALHVQGNTDAFGELFRRHRDRLWSVALRTLGDPEEAADAVQDGLISAYRNAASYRGDAAVTTWLHRIVVNACLDRVRRRTSRPTVALPDDDLAPEASRLTVRRDAMDERETALEINRALAALPPDQAAAVVLIDVEGWSVEEAAVILDCPPGTVKSRCSRGRVKLAATLGHLRNPESDGRVPTLPDSQVSSAESLVKEVGTR